MADDSEAGWSPLPWVLERLKKYLERLVCEKIAIERNHLCHLPTLLEWKAVCSASILPLSSSLPPLTRSLFKYAKREFQRHAFHSIIFALGRQCVGRHSATLLQNGPFLLCYGSLGGAKIKKVFLYVAFEPIPNDSFCLSSQGEHMVLCLYNRTKSET